MCFTTQKIFIKMQMVRKICTELHNIVEASFANVRIIERKHDIHILMETELEKCIYILCRLLCVCAESANWWSRRWKWTSIFIRSSTVGKLRGADYDLKQFYTIMATMKQWCFWQGQMMPLESMPRSKIHQICCLCNAFDKASQWLSHLMGM